MSNSKCDPCSRIDEVTSANKWCVGCEDSLCNICLKTHRGNKMTINHKVIDIEAASAVPSEILISQKKCTKHEDVVIDYFCTQHDSLCCRKCISQDHRSCDQVMPLEEASRNARSSSHFHDIPDGMKQINDILSSLSSNRNENKEEIRNEEKNIITALATFKASLVAKINRLEKAALSNLSNIREQSLSTIIQEQAYTGQSKTQIDKYLEQFNFLMKHGTNQHLFLLLQELQPILAVEQKQLEEFVSKVTEISLVYKQPDDTASGMKYLGSILAQKSPCKVKYKPTKHNEAQMIAETSVSPKSFKFNSRFEPSFDGVTGMVVNKDGNIVIADYDHLRLYSPDGKYIKHCQLGGNAWDVACHKKSGRIVVAIQSKGIQFIDNFTAQRPMPVPGVRYCYGIDFVNDNIYVGGDNGKVCILDYNGKYLKSFTLGTSYLVHLHHDDNKIYLTDESNDVYCIKEDGTKRVYFHVTRP